MSSVAFYTLFIFLTLSQFQKSPTTVPKNKSKDNPKTGGYMPWDEKTSELPLCKNSCLSTNTQCNSYHHVKSLWQCVLIEALPLSAIQTKPEEQMSTTLSKLILIYKLHMINCIPKHCKHRLTGTCHRGKQIHKLMDTQYIQTYTQARTQKPKLTIN